MLKFTMIAGAVSALILSSGAALALSVTNSGSQEHTIGVDIGDSESVHKIPAGETVELDVCKPNCGVTGPWGFSWNAKAGDKLKFDDETILMN